MTYQLCCRGRNIRPFHGRNKKIALATTTSTKFNYQPGSGVPTSHVSRSVRAALLRRARPAKCCKSYINPEPSDPELTYNNFNRATLANNYAALLRVR